jgi:hypothetical protein
MVEIVDVNYATIIGLLIIFGLLLFYAYFMFRYRLPIAIKNFRLKKIKKKDLED